MLLIPIIVGTLSHICSVSRELHLASISAELTVSSQSSHHPQEVLLAQFSLYVHKGGLKPDSFHFLLSHICSVSRELHLASISAELTVEIVMLAALLLRDAPFDFWGGGLDYF